MARYSAIVVLLAAMALASASNAQEGAQEGRSAGRLTAFACDRIPSPLRVEIDAGEDSAAQRRLKQTLIAALAARHAEIVRAAPLVLSLYVEAVREPERRKGRDLGEFSRGNTNDTRTRFRMNLWSNQRDSLLGGRRDQVLARAVNELHVAILIHDKSDGRCIWQGEARYDLTGRDETATARLVIPLLTDRIGHTVRARPFSVE